MGQPPVSEFEGVHGLDNLKKNNKVKKLIIILSVLIAALLSVVVIAKLFSVNNPENSSVLVYGKGNSLTVKIKDLSVDITGKHVVIVEDILDTGNTLTALFSQLEARNPASLRLCCLLDKPERRQKPIQGDFVGFRIPDEFVVGYGLDYDEKYRQLPYVGILKRSGYEK